MRPRKLLLVALLCAARLLQALAADPTDVGAAKEPASKLILDGDIVFGGLFAVHEAANDGIRKCGRIEKDVGVQRLEAMLFAVDRINHVEHILPKGMRVGVHIMDTCSRDTYALEQSMDFVRGRVTTLDSSDRIQCTDGKATMVNRRSPRKPVVAVIGSASSTESIMVANILRLFQIPQISYASTAQELSDKSRYDYFSRVVPPDSLQTSTMLDIVRLFGWSYVSTLADDGSYGEKGIAAFENQARAAGICIARSLKIPRDPTDSHFDQAVTELKAEKRARVVVMFVNEMNVKNFLRSVIRNNQTDLFYFLASDFWGMKKVPVEGQEAAAEGSITILPKRREIREFTEYFANLRINETARNPWFEEFWEYAFKCRFDRRAVTSKLPRCTGKERFNVTTFTQEGLVQMVIDSVYALAHAMRNFILDNCRHLYEQRHYENTSWFDSCPALNPPNGSEVLRYIRAVNFIGPAGNNIQFDSKTGDGIGRYDIFQFQRQKGKDDYAYVKLGDWEPTETRSQALQLDLAQLQWRKSTNTFKQLICNHTNSSHVAPWLVSSSARSWHFSETFHEQDFVTFDVPVSSCSDPCLAGFRTHYQGSDRCCWICVECHQYERLKNKYECEECLLGTVPSENRTECVALPATYMSWSSVWALVPACVSSLGLVFGTASLAIFLRFEKTPVIKASGRELCYIIFAGCMLSFIMTFVTLAKPSVHTCAVFRFGNGFSLSLIYSAIFTKTNRLSRIFNRGIKAMMKRPSYTSPKSQVVICMCLVSVQIIGDVMWLGIDLPETTMTYPDRQTVVLKCKLEDVAIIISLTYNMVLIALCTIFAFKVRDVPENFNEAKYIAFAMYSNCILWLGFLAIYFGTRHDFRIQLTSICMNVSLTAWTILTTIFLPKFYVIYFQPQKNSRRFSMHTAKHETQPLQDNNVNDDGCTGTATSNIDGQEYSDCNSPLGLTMLITSPRLAPRNQNHASVANNSAAEVVQDTQMSSQFPQRPRVHFFRKDTGQINEGVLIASPGSSPLVKPAFARSNKGAIIDG